MKPFPAPVPTPAPSATTADALRRACLSIALAAALAACGGGGGGSTPTDSAPQTPPPAASTPVGTDPPPANPNDPPKTIPPIPAPDTIQPGTSAPTAEGYVPLFAAGTGLNEQIQWTEPDGTLVTMMGSRTTDRHARERGEAWDAPDAGPGRYFTFPTFYFQNRTFGLEIRDEVPAGRQKITVYLHVNDGVFDGTTFSLFRNIQNPDVRDYGWSLNYGFNNPDYGNKPICIAGKRTCKMDFNSNWRTDPHSPLKIGDKIELAPAPRLTRDEATGRALIDNGGSRYYSFEQLYVVGVGMRPWYGIAPNLDSEPLPDATLLGGQASVSYNYSEEPMRVFQQMANNIGIVNTKRFVTGRRLFHTSFKDGTHSEHDKDNPIFTAHVGQIGPRYQQERCIECHVANGRSPVPAIGAKLDAMSVLVGGTTVTDGRRAADATYGLNVQQRALAADAPDHGVSIQRYETQTRTLPDGTKVELVKPVLAFKGPVPAAVSLRQAPQVIGMGLLEAVPEADIVAAAARNQGNADGVRGLVNYVKDPESGVVRVGRFGWKAAKASLRHQAGEALVNDLSVTSPVYPNRSCQAGGTDCRKSATTDLTESELQSVTHYLALIGVPAQRSLRSGFPAGVRVSPEHDVDPAKIAKGSALFSQVKCAACHTPEMKTGDTHPFAELRGQTIRPYTDLLVHDMGPELADNLTEGKATGSFWRTQPLWGIGSLQWVQGGADKTRYLHDGRARTLTEAILWHGGEATKSRTLFEALAKDDRDALIAFLQSL